MSLETDRARYSPGETVIFSASFQTVPDSSSLVIRYHHLNEVVGETTIVLNGTSFVSWQWRAPARDYQGYLVGIELWRNGKLLDRNAVAVDVSSEWSKFPRYGFLSKFPLMQSQELEAIIYRLNRYHLNGLQFYDWQYKHHMPLKGSPDHPDSLWADIANRTIYLSTIRGYLDAAHRHAMKAMAYNLLYGAYTNAQQDGVDSSWGLFKDSNHQTPDMHPLPSSWASNIVVMDPSNFHWREYLLAQEKKVFQALPFDGWHIDQLGDRGTEYNFQGAVVNMPNAFAPFLSAAKESLNVSVVMNAVNEYGQAQIASGPVDFLYTEVWDPNSTYTDLLQLLERGATLTNRNLKNVLAAYMDYNIADAPGWFNTPGVLLTDAVIFAAGGAHIELGEHMLGKEYLPNENLKMTSALEQQLVCYYDFLAAYENVLRDSVTSIPASVSSTAAVPCSNRQQSGAVWYFGRSKEREMIIHFVNFVNATSQLWRDANGTQPEPPLLHNLTVSVATNQTVRSVWVASPDTLGGVPISLSFTQDVQSVSFTLPSLKYWAMTVLEVDNTTSVHHVPDHVPAAFTLGQNFPNPFNPSTTFRFALPVRCRVKLEIFNVLGQCIAEIADGVLDSGYHEYTWKTDEPSGMYFMRMETTSVGDPVKKFVAVKKLVLLK